MSEPASTSSHADVNARPDSGDAGAEAGISLDQLSAAFAQMLGAGDDPYTTPGEADSQAPEDAPQLGGLSVDPQISNDVSADVCELTPRSILEAMLFVGSPGNEPLTSEQVAALMRGVRPTEVDALVRELNDQYAARRCPYSIVTSGAGYRLALRDEFESLRQRFYGKARQVRLSQAAIEVLSIVAYNQPISPEEIHRLRRRAEWFFAHAACPPAVAPPRAVDREQASAVPHHRTFLGTVRAVVVGGFTPQQRIRGVSCASTARSSLIFT